MESENTEPENIDEITESELDEIFERIEATAPRFFSEGSSKKALNYIAIRKKLVEKTVSVFETNFSLDASNIMLGILHAARLNYTFVNNVFDEVLRIFERKRRNLKEEAPNNDVREMRYEMIVMGVKSLARVYFEKQLDRELINTDLAEQLQLIKTFLLDNETLQSNEPFFHAVILKKQKKIEQEIELKKEENNHRQQLKISEPKKESETQELNTTQVNSKYVVPRDEKQVFLALEIMLRLLQSTGNQTDKGKLMSFLSGYSAETMRQFFSKSENWQDKREMLECVRGLCLEFSLASVRKQVDKEIAALDKKQ